MSHSPKALYDAIYFIWKILIKPFVEVIDKIRLKKFNSAKYKEVNYEGEKFVIKIDPDNGTVDREIFLVGVYEPYFLSIIKKGLNLGDVFVDIGANIGQHSLFASSVVGESGKVIAFEPIKRLHNQFQDSIKHNINNDSKFKNIKLYNFGCGEKEENVKIYTADNAGASSIIDSKRDTSSELIKIVAADTVLKEEEKINFIKIDVEGYEYFALLGLKDTISKHHPKILIEYSPYYYDLLDKDHGKHIINFLLGKNYTLYDLENNHKVVGLDLLEYIEENNIQQTNLLAVYNLV